MSLGAPQSQALDAAVANSIADGVTYAVAAGNDNADACTLAPASAPSRAHRGRHDVDRRAPGGFELSARCVDLFAPGDAITSAWQHVRHGDEHDRRHVDGFAARRR